MDGSPNTVLLVIDMQRGFEHPTHWGPKRSNANLESNVAALLSRYRSLATTAGSSSATHKLIHVKHDSLSSDSPLHPSAPGNSFLPCAEPLRGELVIGKTVNSAFIGTELESVLRTHYRGAKGKIWVVGLTTDHCVSTTVRMAGNLGVTNGDGGEKGEVVLVGDATAAWQKVGGGFDAETVHGVHVESLSEFAAIKKTVDVLEEWGN